MTPLRVILDGRCLQDHSAFRGVGRYALGLLRGFSALPDPGLELTVALDDQSAPRADSLVKSHPDGRVLGHPTRSARLNVEHLHRVIRSRVLNRSLRQRGLERASRYSWEKAAAGTLAAYRRALAG